MSEINYLDDRKCINCINAKFKEHFGEGNELFFCGRHKTFVTTITKCAFVIGCRGVDYVSHIDEKPKPKPKEKLTDGQMTIEDWLQEAKA